MRLGAVNWATFFKAHPDTPGKVAAFAYAFEHLEIGGYEQLLRVARSPATMTRQPSREKSWRRSGPQPGRSPPSGTSPPSLAQVNPA